MEETRSLTPAELTAATPPPAPLAAAPALPSPPPAPLWRRVLRVAWLSIGLGVLLEVVLLVLVAYTDNAGASPKPFLSDLVQKVSWGFIVCVGIAFGTTAGKAREAVMGVLGLVSAPAGFAAARMVHKAVSAALGLAGPAASGAFPVLIAGIKGLEFGLLGALIGWIGTKPWGGLGAHAGMGALLGATFGTLILLVMAAAAPGPSPAVTIMSRGINELFFPIGCSLVLYASGAMARRAPG